MGVEGQDEELALKLNGPHLGTHSTKNCLGLEQSARGSKTLSFSHTHVTRSAVQMVSITGGKKRLSWYA